MCALSTFRIQSDFRFFSQQAYISSFSLYPEVPESGADRNSELTLILMASSADPVVFKELLRGKKYIAQVLQSLCVILLFLFLTRYVDGNKYRCTKSSQHNHSSLFAFTL